LAWQIEWMNAKTVKKSARKRRPLADRIVPVVRQLFSQEKTLSRIVFPGEIPNDRADLDYLIDMVVLHGKYSTCLRVLDAIYCFEQLEKWRQARTLLRALNRLRQPAAWDVHALISTVYKNEQPHLLKRALPSRTPSWTIDAPCPKDGLLHRHARRSTAEVLKHLIEHGADVDARDTLGRTPLHCVAGEERVRFVIEKARLLIAAGSDVNATDKTGQTSLHAAARCNRELIELLLRAGADPSMKDELGRTARELAGTDAQPTFLSWEAERLSRALVDKIAAPLARRRL
jgi:hypothetical protein